MKWLGLIINHCSNDHHFNYHKIGLCMVKDITNFECFTPWNVVLPFILYHYAERDPFIIVDCMLCCCLLHPTSGLLKCLTVPNFMSPCKIKLWILSKTLLVTTKFYLSLQNIKTLDCCMCGKPPTHLGSVEQVQPIPCPWLWKPSPLLLLPSKVSITVDYCCKNLEGWYIKSCAMEEP